MQQAIKTQLDWSAYDNYGEGDAYAQIPLYGGSFGKAAAVCINNRQCQRTAKGVMCPSYRATEDIAHSTQHRAATLKAVLNGELGEQPWTDTELQQAMDLCIGCKGCKRECPNGVDMSLLKTETLAQRWQHSTMPWRDRWFAYLPMRMAWLRRFRGLIGLGRIPLVAKLMERFAGISARRSLPIPAAISFIDIQTEPAANQLAPQITVETASSKPELVLLVDTFTNAFEPANAQAALAVLRAAGYQVQVVKAEDGQAEPLCCGRTLLSSGLVAEAQVQARRMVVALWPHIEKGRLVIGLEPSCLLTLRDEYQNLGLGEQAQKIAKSALLFEEFIAKEHDTKRLNLPLQALPQSAKAYVHGHCHQKAYGAMKPMRKVMGLIPGLQTELIESSCCGMAGSFGMEAEHYDISMKMGELDLFPAIRKTEQTDWLVANGFSCRHQIKDGVQRESMHIARLLALALVKEG